MLDILFLFHVLFAVSKKSPPCNARFELSDSTKLTNSKNEKKELIYKLYRPIYNRYGLLMTGFE